ncbi:hypothetical protein N7456_005276 [Penicillium angulare]|uniref:Uncharacterized protein n=1 Tax=Penicillium angulare TaxID=116970 RepID=A0A9W9KK08_9EURO|nr:hypothetical protein N7456_005276 [Penicillium angulare]
MVSSHQLIRNRATLVVPMSGVDFILFNAVPVIGTQGLGGCTVVIIASSQGAILAHIAPLPLPTLSDPKPLDRDPVGDQYVESMMSQVDDLYTLYRNWLQSATVRIICATRCAHNNQRADPELSHHVAMMESHLQSMGLRPRRIYYTIPVVRDVNRPTQGTAFVEAGPDGPIIYHENVRI